MAKQGICFSMDNNSDVEAKSHDRERDRSKKAPTDEARGAGLIHGELSESVSLMSTFLEIFETIVRI